MEYETKLFNDNLKNTVSPYPGEPQPELDKAWHELLKYSNIRVSTDDLRKINRNSIKLATSPGEYTAGLEVHHQLRCLNYIRQFLHPTYCNITEPDFPEHVDHFLDTLREHV
ncbi:MAG: hypothetical protein Q9218_006792, partial [Villophora microphyllina]